MSRLPPPLPPSPPEEPPVVTGAAVALRGVRREYRRGHATVVALDDVSLQVPAGHLVAIRGRSGAGKTTLLNVMGGLDRATSGHVQLGETDLTTLDDEQLTALRRDRVAYVFQAFGLLPVLSAAENVEVPLRLRRTAPQERAARVREVLEAVGLGARAHHRPQELSGGEQQRVAIARALATAPEVLLADEPTGQLDSVTGGRIMDLLLRLVDTHGVTVVVATHDASLLDRADDVVELHDGRVVAPGSA